MEEFEVLGFQIGAWQLFGFAGTLAFSSRFLVQWVASERAGESYVPVAFWYLSLLGSGILMAYGIHERDAVSFSSPSVVLRVESRHAFQRIAIFR